MEMEM